jgi:hypothetical protein
MSLVCEDGELGVRFQLVSQFAAEVVGVHIVFILYLTTTLMAIANVSPCTKSTNTLRGDTTTHLLFNPKCNPPSQPQPYAPLPLILYNPPPPLPLPPKPLPAPTPPPPATKPSSPSYLLPSPAPPNPNPPLPLPPLNPPPIPVPTPPDPTPTNPPNVALTARGDTGGCHDEAPLGPVGGTLGPVGILGPEGGIGRLPFVIAVGEVEILG